MSQDLLEEIKSRGYWHVVIRPEGFVEERIPTLAECQELVERNQVRCRGWYFPHFSVDHIHLGLDYVELAITFLGSINETWRFYQSGLFVLYRGLREDWISEDTWWPPQQKPNIEPGTRLDILSALYQLSEVYEFAARLAQVGIFDNRLLLAVNLVGTEGRQLFFWPSSKYDFPPLLLPPRECEIREIPREKTLDVADFVARSREYSFQHFLWLMERFGFDASPDIFEGDQEKLFERRF